MSKSGSVPPDRKKRPGPAPKPMPSPIDASPRDLARAIMQKPPKKEWRFLEKKKAS